MMNNPDPDDQSVPSPPNSMPFVGNSQDASTSLSPTEPNAIPIVITDGDTEAEAQSQDVSPFIPIVLGPDEVNPPQQPPQLLPVQFETMLIAEKINKYLADGTLEFHDVSFRLLNGELTCILGRNEDGVLSLLRVLALEEEVSTGRLTILNTAIPGLSIEQRNAFRDKHIAYIRQSHLVLVEQTGLMLVAYWLHYFDDLSWENAKEYARLALEDVEISHNRMNIAIEKLSPDEVERINIAKVYARSNRSQRSIYLFEGLFTSLDQIAAEKLVELLQKVARQGKVVVAQANRKDIISGFDQVLEMQDGALGQIR